MASREPRVHSWSTYVLVAANLVMYGIALARGAHPTEPAPEVMIDLGANFPPMTVEHEWWRLGSAMFLHFGALHLALNMVCLWQGRIVETLLGAPAHLAIYAFAGLVGNVASIGFSPLAVTAGASGAVFGVYGAFAAFLVVRKRELDPEAWRTTSRGIAMFLAVNLAFGVIVPNISMTAHVAGLISGFALDVALQVRGPRRPSWRRLATCVLAGALVLGAGAWLVPRPQSIRFALAAFADREQAVLAAAQHLDEQRSRGALTDAEAAAAIERDMVVPWRAGCAELAQLERTPARAALLDAIQGYCDARRTAWETLAGALRASETARDDLLRRHQAAELDVRARATAVSAALKDVD